MLPRLFAIVCVLCVATVASARDAFTPRAPEEWVHPGVLVDREQLEEMKAKVNDGTEPWKGAYDAMMGSELGSMSRNPSPTSTVECGPTSTPNVGCTEEREDALAAYTMALAWFISGTARYAEKAISYMNAWADTLQEHKHTNTPLQTGWASASWARAAEIIRYTFDGWNDGDVTAFEAMLKDKYLPIVIKGSNSNGNWELVMLEAALGIAVFLEDRGSYDIAMDKFTGRVPAYIYLQKDGEHPTAAPGSNGNKEEIIKYWQGQPTFQANGIAQETCRDFVHTGYGLSSISHIAETSRIQGTDLYSGDVGERLRYGLGFHADLETGTPKPDWLCPNKELILGLGPVTEVAYNALHNRLGIPMEKAQQYTEQHRPAGTNKLFVAWETLTHGENDAGESVRREC